MESDNPKMEKTFFFASILILTQLLHRLTNNLRQKRPQIIKKPVIILYLHFPAWFVKKIIQKFENKKAAVRIKPQLFLFTGFTYYPGFNSNRIAGAELVQHFPLVSSPVSVHRVLAECVV